MKCLLCSHDNASGTVYCQSCGQPMNMTRDQVREILFAKAKKEQAERTTQRIHRFLIFAVVFLMVAIGARLLAGGGPDPGTLLPVPSVTVNAETVLVSFDPPGMDAAPRRFSDR